MTWPYKQNYLPGMESNHPAQDRPTELSSITTQLSNISIHEKQNIDSLPPEILSYIFSLTLPNRRYFNQNSFEVTISHVSSYWRGVALTTSCLWTEIEVDSRKSESRLRTYLRRAGASNLDIVIDIQRYENIRKRWSPRREGFIKSITNQIISNIHRIRCLSILCFSKANLLKMVAPLHRCHAPNLQRLVATYDSAEASAGPPSPLIQVQRIRLFEGGASRLAYLNIDLPNLNPFDSFLGNITSLELNFPPSVGTRNISFQRFIDVVKVPQNLLYLTIRGSADINAWHLHQNGTQHYLPHLKGLRLLDSGTMAVQFILSVTMPQLESLWLDCSNNNFDNFHLLFNEPQLSNKFSVLKYLTLPNYNLYDAPNFARIFRSITHLHLPHSSFFHAPELHRALTYFWLSVDTIVLSLFREQYSQRLFDIFQATLAQRQRSGRTISRILVNEDHLAKTRIALAPLSGTQTRLEVLNTSNYAEPWWNKLDQPELSQ